MSEAAQLRAEDGVAAGLRRREVDVGRLAGHGVLLQAHLGYGEAVDDVLRMQREIDFASDGQDELAGDEIVRTVAVRRVEPEGIAFARRDENGFGLAKRSVCAGIAEVPSELHTRDLHLHGREAGACVALRCPELLGAGCEECE